VNDSYCQTIARHAGTPLALALVLLAGCSDAKMATYPVEGTVTLDGQPVAGGSVLFRPAQGPIATGKVDEQGRFQLRTYGEADGAVAGRHAVRLVPPDKKFDVAPDELEFITDGESLRQPPPFPAKYLAFETSGLTADVKEDDNRFDFELQP